jgi:hypothetical protein
MTCELLTLKIEPHKCSILTHHCSLFDLWNPSTANEESDPVLASVTAVGLVGVAQMTRSQAALEAARKSYGKALQLTNAALRDQAEAVKDTTMLSVLVLGLFEMIGGSSARTTEAWQKHLNGAAALAKIRGMAQFRSRAGIRMFFMLTQNTMISCIQNELPMRTSLYPRWRLSPLCRGRKKKERKLDSKDCSHTISI